jgi:hypothetical protein
MSISQHKIIDEIDMQDSVNNTENKSRHYFSQTGILFHKYLPDIYWFKGICDYFFHPSKI